MKLDKYGGSRQNYPGHRIKEFGFYSEGGGENLTESQGWSWVVAFIGWRRGMGES